MIFSDAEILFVDIGRLYECSLFVLGIDLMEVASMLTVDPGKDVGRQMFAFLPVIREFQESFNVIEKVRYSLYIEMSLLKKP